MKMAIIADKNYIPCKRVFFCTMSPFFESCMNHQRMRFVIIELCERFVLLLTYNESITMKLMKRDAKIKKLYLLDNFNTMNIERGCMYLKNVKF